MGVLDSVVQMKSQGKSDSEIIQILRSQGVPPRDIQNALSQAQIKSAVYGQNPIEEGMQQSIVDNPPTPQPAEPKEQETYTPQANYQSPPPVIDYSSQQTYSQPPSPQPASSAQTSGYDYQNQYPADQYSSYDQSYGTQYPEQDYSQQDLSQDYYPQDDYSYAQSYSTSSDTNSLIEISEQVFTDKIKKVQDTLEALNEFKALTDAKVKTMEERLKRIEKTIDQLQISILDKIGSYGQNLNSIKKEMNMMQDSFGKVIDPLLDKRKRI